MRYWHLLTITSVLALTACSTMHHSYDRIDANHYHPSAKSIPQAKGLDEDKIDSSYQVAPLTNPDQVEAASITPPGSDLTPQPAENDHN